ncbi:hypothetical protein [Algiphilus sp.]|uniref:hypothetical protein n=1 Tax=Algiphilus sp. TaxID=1872431 RepID=UPI0025BD19D3|nr:hypothetical protein [Algiphilus sp.]MCK5771771.1 hypothetical protein [Algiphilus sp.]
MTETLADIEALSLQCRSEQSKAYIAEALHCYKASAYRAAIVTTWIALVFDLIDKIRELSLSGDANAKALETKYESYIAQIEQGNLQGIKAALEFEREILETCRDQLQFLDPQQFIDLQRLREDRHRCAHPSFQQVGVPYSPSAEHARLHLRNIIIHVLSQPPVQGKAALAELKTMVASSYFPSDRERALLQLRSSSLNAALEPLVRGFVDTLVFGFLTNGDVLFYKQKVLAALNAALSMHPAIVEQRLRKQLNKAIRDVPDATFSGAACLASRIDNAWALLDQASREKVRAFVENGPKDEVLAGLKTLAAITDLNDVVRARINALELDDLADAIEPLGIGELAKERALQFLQEVGSWDRANAVFSKAVLPLFGHLDRQDIERIVCMPTEHESDLPGAHGYRLFLSKVRESQLIPDAELDQLLRDNKAGYLLPQDEDS